MCVRAHHSAAAQDDAVDGGSGDDCGANVAKRRRCRGRMLAPLTDFLNGLLLCVSFQSTKHVHSQTIHRPH